MLLLPPLTQGQQRRGQHTSLLPQFKMCEFTLPFSNKFGGVIFFFSLSLQAFNSEQ